MNSKRVALFLTPLMVCVLGQEIDPSLQLFNYDPPRHTYSITLKDSTPTLPAELLGSYYFCSGPGVWILYQNATNYASNGFLIDQPGCRTRRGTFPILSVWLLESSKYPSIPTINLFQERFWGNPQSSSVFTSDQRSYYGVIKSAAVTGSQAVTFYAEEDFNGRSVCMQTAPGALVPYMGHFVYLSGFQPGQVKSFRFGCHSSNRISSEQQGNIESFVHQ